MAEAVSDRIRRLVEAISRLEHEIGIEVEIMKDNYSKAAAAMPQDKSYFLSGLQTGSVVKSYLLSSRGIEVHGEGIISSPEFIDSVMRFANYPKRKIEVLTHLATHLQNIYIMISSHQAQ